MTKLLPRPDLSGFDPEDPARRDEARESDWYPIFRSGKYPQGEFKRSDIDQIVTEFTMHGRRSPIVNVHLTKETAPFARSYGNVIALRAVDSTDPRYPGTRVLEARSKTNYSAAWETREGSRRNLSCGFAKATSVIDQVKRWSLHHLALLGAEPPGVMGLPEAIFAESVEEGDSILLFSTDASLPVLANESTGSTNKEEERVKETISFSEHEALLSAAESTLKLAHGTEVASFQAQITELSGQVAAATADAAAAKAEVETVKADVEVKVETAKQEGIKEGEKKGLENGHRMFEETRTKDSLAVFCEKLHAEGKLTAAEVKGIPGEGDKAAVPPMAERLFAMPESVRADFKALLEERPANLKQPLERPPVVRQPTEGGLSTEVAFQERVNVRCVAIMRQTPGIAFAQAWEQAETDVKKEA